MDDTRALLVLGAGRFESKRRARYAASISNGYPIIISGGRIKTLFGTTTEREVDYIGSELEKAGISQDLILTDGASYSTKANFINSREILEQKCPNARTVELVTGKAHMKRAMRLAKEGLKGYKIVPRPVPITGLTDLLVECGSFFWEHFRRHSEYNY